MRMLNLRNIIACTVLALLSQNASEGGQFKNRRQSSHRQAAASRNSRYVPRTKIGQNRLARKDAQDTKTAQRTGQTFEEVRQKRIRRLEMLGAIVGGAGAGLSGAASTMSYSTPATIAPRSSSSLPSNFSNQTQWNSFNRSYSTNPWHAPVR